MAFAFWMLNVHLYSFEHYTHYCSTLCYLQWNELYSLSHFHFYFSSAFLCCWCCKCICINPLCNIVGIFLCDCHSGSGIGVDRWMAHSFTAHGAQNICVCPFKSAKNNNKWLCWVFEIRYSLLQFLYVMLCQSYVKLGKNLA